jgi:hypothetical protein
MASLRRDKVFLESYQLPAAGEKEKRKKEKR